MSVVPAEDVEAERAGRVAGNEQIDGAAELDPAKTQRQAQKRFR